MTMPVPPPQFLQAGCPSCHPANNAKAMKAKNTVTAKIKHTFYRHYLPNCDIVMETKTTL